MEPTQSPSSGDLSPGGCLLRLFWMGFGNAALLFATIHLAVGERFATAAGIFGTIIVMLLATRALDILRFGGLTTSNRPATKRDLARYSVGLVLASAFLAGVAIAARGAAS